MPSFLYHIVSDASWPDIYDVIVYANNNPFQNEFPKSNLCFFLKWK